MPTRRAKIAATLGPACESRAMLGRLIEAGLNVARINFSHGDAAGHIKRVALLRKVARKAGHPVAVLGDLQGPRFRLGELTDGPVTVRAGEGIRLHAGKRKGGGDTIPVAYAALARDVKRGNRILIDDGKVELVVERVRGDIVSTQVVRGGELSDRKGMNLPGVKLSVPPLMPKDRRDLKTAVEMGADWIAVSFVRQASDVRVVRRLLKRYGDASIPVMAKIERPEALDDIDAILEEADGLLVARGDLGVELPPEQVPLIQKDLIERGCRAGKPVMTATQMLDSMRRESRPTRAEASDVANAVLDGSASLLLTAETAVGKYPVESVAMMDRIIREAESSARIFRPGLPRGSLRVSVATSLAACRAAYDVGASYIVVFTQTGFSARQCGRFRPSTPIMAYTPDARTARRLNMLWGVEPREFRRLPTIEKMVRALDRELLGQRRVKRGDAIVTVMGTPVGVGGTTNLMEVRRVGVDPTRRKVVTEDGGRQRVSARNRV